MINEQEVTDLTGQRSVIQRRRGQLAEVKEVTDLYLDDLLADVDLDADPLQPVEQELLDRTEVEFPVLAEGEE